MRRVAAYRIIATFKKVVAIAMTLAMCVAILAASPSSVPIPNSSASPVATPNPTASGAAKSATAAKSVVAAKLTSPSRSKFPDGAAVIGFLSQVIGWYRHLSVEQSLVTDPAEMLFVADDRQMADEILNLSFEFAKADAQLLASISNPEGHPPPGAGGQAASQVAAAAADADADIKADQAGVKALQDQLANASSRKRSQLEPQIAAAQSELDLAEARGEALHTVLQFENGNLHTEGGAAGASGLTGEIEELEKSVPEAERNAKPAAPSSPSPRPAEAGGILDLVEDIFSLNRKMSAITDTIDLTNALAQSVERMRAPLSDELRKIDQEGDDLAKGNLSNDVPALRGRKASFESLIERHKLVAAAAIPLNKEAVLLGLYSANLARWRASVARQSNLLIRRLVIRLVVLVVILMSVFGAASLWRRFAFRYVQDTRRRYQFLQARRIVLVIVVSLIVLFNFANEIGSLATVMGFAAAGIAVALQNVILSIAGYFFLIGRFGIKVGDRVQVSGVTGDVVDIGLVKLSLMELGGNGNDRQPTGRVVVFSNAVVFQPSGNFFKQIPDTNFVWNEVTLTIAPECDYRLAEKLLLGAVEEVFSRYRESIHRQYLQAERSLNIAIDSPKPQSRMLLGQNGLQLTIRYPAETRSSVQTADEVSRRLLDAISRVPGIKLVPPATPNIQPATTSADSDGAAPSPPAQPRQEEPAKDPQAIKS
jgi:small-conductance mechanosensitive channel